MVQIYTCVLLSSARCVRSKVKVVLNIKTTFTEDADIKCVLETRK